MAECIYSSRDVALHQIKEISKENLKEAVKIYKEESFCDFLDFCQELGCFTEQVRTILYWSSLVYEDLEGSYFEEDLSKVNEILDNLGLTNKIFVEYSEEDEE